MKKGCLIALLTLFFSTVAFAEQPEIVSYTFDIPDTWQQILDESPMSSQEFSAMSLQDLWNFLSGQFSEVVRTPLQMAAKLIGILVLAGVIKSLCNEKSLSSMETGFEMVVSISVFLLCSPLLLELEQQLKSSLESCRTYLGVFIPVFTSAMVSCGQAGSAAVYGGLFLGLANFIAVALSNVGIPILQVLLVMSACGIIETPVDFSALTKGISKWCRWLLTFCATIFGTLLTLQSVFAQSADSLALKTGKFLLSSSIPVVGKAVSDAMGSVLAGMKLLKGSIGFAAVAVIGLTFLPLIVQCIVCQILFALGEIGAGATGNTSCGKLFRSMADFVSLNLAMIVFFSFVVISTTILMIVLGNGGA